MIRGSWLPSAHRTSIALGTMIVMYLYWVITKDPRPFAAYTAILAAMLFINLANRILAAKKK